MEAAHGSIVAGMREMLGERRTRWERARTKLEQLSPLRILERGYAIVSNERGIVKDAAEAEVGSAVRVRVARGEFAAEVTQKGLGDREPGAGE
jgi:exodeoxyribonuclease VII large subunit